MLAMSAIDTAKEIVRITSTAGLSKDVIDLLEKKVSLLTEKITTLETENSELKTKTAHLEKELKRLRPQQDDLEEGAIQILKAMFAAGGDAFLEWLAPQLGM